MVLGGIVLTQMGTLNHPNNQRMCHNILVLFARIMTSHARTQTQLVVSSFRRQLDHICQPNIYQRQIQDVSLFTIKDYGDFRSFCTLFGNFFRREIDGIKKLEKENKVTFTLLLKIQGKKKEGNGEKYIYFNCLIGPTKIFEVNLPKLSLFYFNDSCYKR